MNVYPTSTTTLTIAVREQSITQTFYQRKIPMIGIMVFMWREFKKEVYLEVWGSREGDV